MPKRSGSYYNRTNTCDRCKIEKLKPHKAYREYVIKDKKDVWTGRWLCNKCFLKRSTDRRTGNLDPNSEQAKGDLFEELTCKWRGVKNLNIDNDNFNSPIDHSRDPELGIIQTKGALLGERFVGILKYECWGFNAEHEIEKEFDHLLFYCASRDMKNIERVYIFPWEEILKRTSVCIYKNPSMSINIHWYEKYRVKDELILKQINDIWTKILQENDEKKKRRKSK